MSRTEDQPWSPFPVQDWSSLPHDPMAGSSVDPSWAPPRRPRPWWLPLLVFALIGGLIGGAAFVWDTVGFNTPRTAATAFLPPDGTAAYERVETRGPDAAARQQVTESARFRGVNGLLAFDTTFGTRLLGETFEGRDTVEIWRTTSTVYDDPAAPYATTRAYRTNGPVELLGESRPGAGYVYSPPLVELPADVAPGSQWSGTGSAGDVLDYATAFRAAAGEEEDCLDVTGELRLSAKEGRPGRTVTLERTWCEGRGLVASAETSADLTTRTVQTAATPPRTPATVDTPLRWDAPQRWTERALKALSIDPTFGQEALGGTPRSVTPVRTESGLVVRAAGAVNDLVALTPKTPTAWVAAWRSHVPGTILTLRAFGNVILVTTSERRLVAYSDLGIRLWERTLDELGPTPPVRVSDGEVVLVDLAGVVQRLELGTGRQVWQHRVGVDVNVIPAVGAGVVVVMDRGGTVTALDEGTGERRWTTELLGLAAGFVGDTLVVLQDQTAHGLDPATGDRRWLRPFVGGPTELQPLGDRLVLATEAATVLLDDSGRVTARLPGYLRVTVAGDRMVGWGVRDAEVVDRTGIVAHRFRLPDLTLAVQDRFVLGTPQGVLLFNIDWTFVMWADER